jgi:hypothetical protein
MTEPLSPAAQAVFWAFNSEFDWIEDGVPGFQFKAISAALRATVQELKYFGITEKNILAIATELENSNV